MFAQVGNYKGHLLGKSSFPTGTCGAGRRSELVQGVRTATHAYLRDPEYGDEAYDLQADPNELNNVIKFHGRSEPGWVTDLRHRVDLWEQQCARLPGKLGVVPGNRGFDTPYRPFRENPSVFV